MSLYQFYLSQRCWGRSCLHLAAALRAGHWRWHLAGIRREIHFTRPLARMGTANGSPETRWTIGGQLSC